MKPEPIEELRCPPCAGRKHPERQRDSMVRWVFKCPVCKRHWVYSVQIELAVKDRIPSWHYSKARPVDG